MDFSEAYNDTCSAVGLAARRDDLASLRDLLENGSPIDVRDNRGWAPIHEAAFYNSYLCLGELLGSRFCREDKSLMDMVTFEEDSALGLAARRGNVECVKLLIEHRADLKNCGCGPVRFGYTALWEAVSAGSVECVRLLLEAASTVAPSVINRNTFDGQTPLHLAVETRKFDIINELLKHGARVDVSDENHITPLFLAAQSGYLECLKLLVGASISQGKRHLINKPACDGATPLFLAAQKGHQECVRFLLAKGADPHLKAESPFTLPVHAAVQFRHYGCMDLLLPVTSRHAIKECDISLVDVMLPNMDLKCFQTLIKHGVNLTEDLDIIPADMAQENSYSIFPFVTEEPLSYKFLSLMGLCVGGDDDAFEDPRQRRDLTLCLLEAGLSPDPQIGGEIPPIVAAVYSSNAPVLELLLKHGADVDVRHPEFMGDVAVTVAAGLVPPSSCLLLLFLYGASVDSCFGRPSQDQSLGSEEVFPVHKWSVQKILFMYHGLNPWLNRDRLKALVSLSWSPQLYHGLKPDVLTERKFQEMEQVAADCSTLGHLCRRQIFRTLAMKNCYRRESLENLDLPAPVIDYLLSSVVGRCYQELVLALEKDRSTPPEDCN